MKPKVLWVLLVFFCVGSSQAAADNRFIVRAPSGLPSLQQVCLTLGCNVSGGLDGSVGRLFLVTTSDLVDPTVFLQTLRSQPAITNAELDALLRVMQLGSTPTLNGTAPASSQNTAPAPPSGLSDTTLADYFAAMVIPASTPHPPTPITRLPHSPT